MNFESFLALPASHPELQLVELDPLADLEEQLQKTGPWHLVLHKVTDELVAARNVRGGSAFN